MAPHIGILKWDPQLIETPMYQTGLNSGFEIAIIYKGSNRFALKFVWFLLTAKPHM